MQPVSTLNEVELLLLLKHGDEKAFEGIYNLYSSRLFGNIYLFRIAENLTYDLFRKIARDKKLQSELIAQACPGYRHVEEEICSKESVEMLREIIIALPPQRRKIFRLVKLEGRTYAEVSKLLNISTSTINDHVVKATKFIREQMHSDVQFVISPIIAILLLEL